MITYLTGQQKDLGGGFVVERLLPSAHRGMVGPFVFADHFGPTVITPGTNIDVRPHPHIGLATVTFLLEGTMMHRDNLGSVQRIEPGAINLMTAGRGIVHSERRPEDFRQKSYPLHGLQLWVGLPQSMEEGNPSFAHTPASAIPRFSEQEAEVRVVIGAAFGRSSPVVAASPTLLVAIKLASQGRLVLPSLASEVAVLPLTEDISVEGQRLQRGVTAVIDRAAGIHIEANSGGEVVLLGGEPLGGHRHIWWNFVSSRKERIRQAADDWVHQRFGRVEGEHDFIPLPESGPLF